MCLQGVLTTEDECSAPGDIGRSECVSGEVSVIACEQRIYALPEDAIRTDNCGRKAAFDP